MIHRAVALAFASALMLSRAAFADEEPAKAACVRSYEEAQKKRIAGDFPAAKDELKVCSHPSCPALVRSDCTGWLREVEAATPSILVIVRNAEGADVGSAQVFVDDEPMRVRAPGEAVELKPGLRRFRVEVAGEPPLERSILVNAGEKNRVVALVVGEARAAPAKPSGTFTGPFVLGAIGAAAFASGIVVDIAGTVRLHDLRGSCAPGCSPGNVDGTRAEILVGDSVLAAGVVLLGAATVYYLTRRASRSRDALLTRSLTVRF